MNQNIIVRVVAAVAVIGLCMPITLRGWNIVQFSIAEAKLEADAKRDELLQRWMNVPGLTFVSRDTALNAITNLGDDEATRRRRDQEVAILAARPLSQYYWLLLADMRLITGEAPDRINEALALAVLTGPNEGYLMVRRGLFGVWIWEMLPQDAKRRAASDLESVQLTDAQKASFRSILSKKADDVRNEIREYLSGAGFSDERLKNVGFES